MQPKRRVCYERGVKSRAKAAREPQSARLRRPPPLHQATLEESIARLGLRGATSKRMFGGLCYYANDKPFSTVLGAALALKPCAAHLRSGRGRRDGRLFHAGGADSMVRGYLDPSC